MTDDQNPPVPSALRIRRGAVIGAAGASGLLVLLSMFVDPVPDADGVELIRGYSEDLTRSGWHTNLIHYGFALFAPVVYAMVGLVRARGAWLANVAGVFAILGLSTLPGLVLLDFTSVAAALATDVDTAWTIEEELGQLPAFILIAAPAFVAAVLALPLAIVALWRAGLFPGVMAALALPGGGGSPVRTDLVARLRRHGGLDAGGGVVPRADPPGEVVRPPGPHRAPPRAGVGLGPHRSVLGRTPPSTPGARADRRVCPVCPPRCGAACHPWSSAASSPASPSSCSSAMPGATRARRPPPDRAEDHAPRRPPSTGRTGWHRRSPAGAARLARWADALPDP